MVTHLSPADHARITAAVTAAEATTDGEIVAVVADRSDAYHDAVSHWALLATFVVMAAAAAQPQWLRDLALVPSGGWGLPLADRELLLLMVATAAVTFVAVRLLVGMTALRYILTPGSTRARRVRRKAVDLFRVGVQTHTAERIGVLLYLSIAERRAEIVADRTAHAAIPSERWGDILANLLAAVHADNITEGMVTAVDAVGGILAEHFPKSGRDEPELPDRLIRL